MHWHSMDPVSGGSDGGGGGREGHSLAEAHQIDEE